MNSIAKESRPEMRSAQAEQVNSAWSEDGRLESFELNGDRFVIDWDEIDPPEGDAEPGIPHAIVMQETERLLEELISIRAVKHGAVAESFAGARESSLTASAALSTAESQMASTGVA